MHQHESLRHHAVVIGGERVGDLVSLGLRVVFYTTDPRLETLDGAYYCSMESAVEAARNALRKIKALPGLERRCPPYHAPIRQARLQS